MIDWLDVARQWSRVLDTETHVQGRRESELREFARKLEIDPSSVRRCFAALRFVETLHKDGRIESVDALAAMSLEKLTILQRVARLSMEEAVKLLGKSATIRELRAGEVVLRADLAQAMAAQPNANLIVRRFSEPLFKDAAIEAYMADARVNGRQAVRANGRGAFMDAAHVIARTKAHGPFQAARVVPSAAHEPYPSRHNGIATLAAAMSRVFQRFDLIAEASDDAEGIAASLHAFGKCGAGVLLLASDGTLEEVHPATRLKAPDMLFAHAAALNARFLPT